MSKIKKVRKSIGIVGGLGAAASARFYSLLVKECQKSGCVKDSDFPEIIIHSIPSEGISEAGVANSYKLINDLIRSIKLLNRCKVDYIIIACNTVHCYLDILQNKSKAKIINMISSTAYVCSSYETVGLISTRSTKDIKLYESELEKFGVGLITTTESQQVIVEKAIEDVTSGTLDSGTKVKLFCVVRSMINSGAEKIILGCSELPLAISPNRVLIDAGECVIREVVSLI